jgi:glutamate dehydrogenase
MSANIKDRQADRIAALRTAKDNLLRRAAEASRSGVSPNETSGEALAAFLRRYYRHVVAEDLVDRRAEDVLAAALSHRSLAGSRPQGTATVRVTSPEGESHSLVEVVSDDMPFLVDSVTAELSRHDRAIHLVIHPQLVVRRDIAGRLLAVCDASSPESAGPDCQDAVVESWMHVEIDRVGDEEQLARLNADLERVLRDVREAVEDWPKTRALALSIAEAVTANPPVGITGLEVEETAELLRWLADDHFTFLGSREYTLTVDESDGLDRLRAVPGSGLGILRADQPQGEDVGRLPQEISERARQQQLLVVTKANSRSTVHRPAYLDYVGVKTFDEQGQVTGERRFLGLFTSAAYNESIQRIPVLRRKAAEVLARSGFASTSHSGKDLLQILETYPRDELFQIAVDDLEQIVLSVLHLQERRQLRLFLRRDDYGRFMSCMVYLPRDRYTTQVRRAMEEILLDAFGGVSIDYTALVSESVLARLHFVVRVDEKHAVPEVDPVDVEAALVAATRSWDDDFFDALTDTCGDVEAAVLAKSYAGAFPEAYKEDLPAGEAVVDLQRLEALEDGDIDLSLYTPPDAAVGERRLKLYRVGEPVSLSLVLPRLQVMGVEVVDERPYEIDRVGRPTAWVYDFGLRYVPTGELPGEDAKTLFQDAVAAVWAGQAESDGFNALVLRAGLTWRQAMILRAYAKYLRQGGSTFSQTYIEECLTSNVHLARLLVRLFEARFDPEHQESSSDLVEVLLEEIGAALDAVESLDQDRILRSFLGAITATLRTSYFQVDAEGRPKPYVAFKLDPQKVPDLPQPRPRYEIWVYSPRVEGVHLRFGAVARGGLRWSDRREDFRTEVLGLVKAQMVKNAVIVPVGAKGGFVVKHPPADPGNREAVLAEGIACYRTFISGLLDVTDNLVTVDGRTEVVPPPRVVRHDGDDTYLVVAADKGTATFSDIANQVAVDYDFWLGDAFASGGSVGYDHKAMGITARGAWESVKRHFLEMGVDTQSEDFTVVGVGDMSGDVFGNGMLLSEHIRLVAAFDHRHVFLDPDPDPAASYAERRRLFDLPRSSWGDYDSTLLSPGGGIYPRSAKSIPVSAQVRARLGLPASTTALSPPELLKAVLTAPVDLLWNGGIGTYVKASTETHADVGDKANDAIRVNGAQVRAKVVGEGGNLGLTQLGRIEYSLRGADGSGGRVNTDAIDNSAGVDTSDHEVNIKILLDQAVRDGVLDRPSRNSLLADMTDEVARLVLSHNYEQNVLLGIARIQAPAMLSVHERYLKMLEQRGEIDRALEFLPAREVIEQREAAGLGLTSSELAVLEAYAKITLTTTVLDSELPDDPWLTGALRHYFPEQVVATMPERLAGHPLRREIVTSWLINDMVNRAGLTYVFRAQEETGASPIEIVRAYSVVREVFGLDDFWRAVSALDHQVPTDVQAMLYLEYRRLVDRSTRWLVQARRASIDVLGEVEHFRPEIERLVPMVPDLLVGSEHERLLMRQEEFAGLGVPQDLATRGATLLDSFSLLDVVEIAAAEKLPAEEVAAVYFVMSERMEVDKMLTRITGLPRDDRWTALARSALRYDLYAALAGLTSNVLTATSSADGPAERITAWEKANSEGVTRAQATLTEIIESDIYDLATMSVALRTIRTLLRG